MLVITYFLCVGLGDNVLGTSIKGEFETQKLKRSIKNNLNTSTTGINTSNSRMYQDVLTNILLQHHVQPNYDKPNEFFPKFWSVVHNINDTTTNRARYNGVVTNEDNDNERMTTKEYLNHKPKREVLDGTIPCYLCKASGHSTDVFSNMVSLKLIDPNDTGCLLYTSDAADE